MKKHITTVVLSLVILVASTVRSQAVRYVIGAGATGNHVTFLSKAPMETFEGKTSLITGYVEIDPDRVAGDLNLHFEVDLASLDTGKDKRNAHMRERHLETETFPTATFDGAKIIKGGATKLVAGTAATFQVEGDFNIHGVSRRTVVHADVTLLNEDGRNVLHIVARFDVALSAHDISRPKFLFMKLGDVQNVTVELTAVPSQ